MTKDSKPAAKSKPKASTHAADADARAAAASGEQTAAQQRAEENAESVKAVADFADSLPPSVEAPFEPADTDGPPKAAVPGMPAMDAPQQGAPATSNAPANLAKQAEAKDLAMIPQPDASAQGQSVPTIADSNLAPGQGTGPDGLLAPGDVNVRASADTTRVGMPTGVEEHDAVKAGRGGKRAGS